MRHVTFRRDPQLQASRAETALRKDNPKGLRADQVNKIARILARLDEVDQVAGMDLPGFRLHALKGDLKGLERFRQLVDHLPV